MKKTIKEDLRLAFKDDGVDNISDTPNQFTQELDLDEIIGIVQQYLKSKKDSGSDEFDADNDFDLDDNNEYDFDNDVYDDTDNVENVDGGYNFSNDSSKFDDYEEYEDYDNDGTQDSDFNIDDLQFADADDTESNSFSDDLELEDEDVQSDDTSNDFQGDIRTVKGAALVYKRKTEDGTFEELWVYNVGKDIKAETEIRRAVLAGTDINPSNNQSEVGEQNADVATVGNVQFLHITGLPN